VQLQQQKSGVEQFAHEKGFDNLVFFEECGVSGLALNRPAMNSLMAAVHKGEIRAVLTLDIARISRDGVTACQWLRSMEKQGVSVLFAEGGGALEAKTSSTLLPATLSE
jgi:DNA invertase Pin-like site-specific DNA recombinase